MPDIYTKDFFRECGAKGGKKGGAKTAKRGKKYYQELQRKSVEARMRNKEVQGTLHKLSPTTPPTPIA